MGDIFTGQVSLQDAIWLRNRKDSNVLQFQYLFGVEEVQYYYVYISFIWNIIHYSGYLWSMLNVKWFKTLILVLWNICIVFTLCFHLIIPYMVSNVYIDVRIVS